MGVFLKPVIVGLIDNADFNPVTTVLNAQLFLFSDVRNICKMLLSLLAWACMCEFPVQQWLKRFHTDGTSSLVVCHFIYWWMVPFDNSSVVSTSLTVLKSEEFFNCVFEWIISKCNNISTFEKCVFIDS